MSTDWTTTKIGAVSLRVTKGTTPTTIGGRFVEQGISFVKVESITSDGRIDRQKLAHIDDETNALLSRSVLERDDLLFTIAGTIGRVALVQDEILPANTNQAVAIVRPNRDVILPRYLYYVLGDDTRVRQALTRVVQSVQANFSLGELSSLEIPLPPLSEQRAIAHVLGTLDDKIDLNRRMNETLEAISRSLFKSWFVDFEPVRAKAEGHDPGLPPSIADLFPSSFEESDLGEVPTGWGVGAFGDVADHPRRSVQPEAIPKGTPYIALEHMPRGSIALTDWGTSDRLESNKFEFKKGEILFGKLRPYFHKVGVAPVDGVCSTDIVVVAPRSPEWFGLALGHASSTAFVHYTNSASTGTKMPRTNWNDMSRYALVLPPEPIAREFTGRARLSVERIISATHEIRTLTDLRNTLLPKLISGELRVKDAQRAIEATNDG